MSEVTESNPLGSLVAGNQAENLAGFDRDEVVAASLPSAADLDAVAAEKAVAAATETVSDTPATLSAEEALDEENTFDVSRAEFIELQDAVLRGAKKIEELEARLEKYNVGAPHKI